MKIFRVTVHGLTESPIVSEIKASRVWTALDKPVWTAVHAWQTKNGRKTSSNVMPESLTIEVELLGNVKCAKRAPEVPKPIAIGDLVKSNGFLAKVIAIDGEDAQVEFLCLQHSYGDIFVDDAGVFIGTAVNVERTEDGTTVTIDGGLTQTRVTIGQVGITNISLERRREKIQRA
ncbi:MAG: hypothetical protein ACLPN2_19010, partial [Terriglobales bacterium]